jgi:hypothetical protein
VVGNHEFGDGYGDFGYCALSGDPNDFYPDPEINPDEEPQ